MIHKITMDRWPLAPGAARPISVDSDGDIIVTLHCIRRHPLPVVMVPCGTIVLRPRLAGQIRADPAHFPHGTTGEIQLALVDQSDGHRMDLTVRVQAATTESESGPGVGP